MFEQSVALPCCSLGFSKGTQYLAGPVGFEPPLKPGAANSRDLPFDGIRALEAPSPSSLFQFVQRQLSRRILVQVNLEICRLTKTVALQFSENCQL